MQRRTPGGRPFSDLSSGVGVPGISSVGRSGTRGATALSVITSGLPRDFDKDLNYSPKFVITRENANNDDKKKQFAIKPNATMNEVGECNSLIEAESKPYFDPEAKGTI